ncbi:MAG: antibiotic biosynthesis monooxygenase [Bacteroidales bacterium]|nr:antibiotic biosynthesis monooxygenase [Bacteroidales bacterium]
MIVTLVHIWVKEIFIQDFIAASFENHKHSLNEPGNLRFDILQDADDPAKFTFYEAYESGEAVAAHKNTAHYLKWKDAVSGWMAKPRQGIRHNIIFPAEKTAW